MEEELNNIPDSRIANVASCAVGVEKSEEKIVKTIEVLKFMVPCLFDDIPTHATIRTWLSMAGAHALEHKRISVDEAKSIDKECKSYC